MHKPLLPATCLLFSLPCWAAPEAELIKLENPTLAIAVSPKNGGELSSLKVKVDQQWHELLYRGGRYQKRRGWRGKAPLLWPATSFTSETGKRDKDNGYKLANQQYKMPFHGFAKKLPWKLVENSGDYQQPRIHLRLTDSEQSRHYYPFSFKLDVNYSLQHDKLVIHYRVGASNTNELAMPFTIGNHITFNTPLLTTTDSQDFGFYNYCQKQLLKNSDNVATGELKENQNSTRQKLSSLPERNARLFSHCPDTKFLLLEDKDRLAVSLSQQASYWPEAPFAQLNLWASEEYGFISPQPWVGGHNSLNTEMGLIELLPGQTWDWTVSIKININQPGIMP